MCWCTTANTPPAIVAPAQLASDTGCSTSQVPERPTKRAAPVPQENLCADKLAGSTRAQGSKTAPSRKQVHATAASTVHEGARAMQHRFCAMRVFTGHP